MFVTKTTRIVIAVLATLIMVSSAWYFLFGTNHYDKAMRETSLRLTSLVNIELNSNNAGDITYGDLEKKLEESIKDTETLYAGVEKPSFGSASEFEQKVLEFLTRALDFNEQ